jgi:hypothetical protein
MVQLVGGLLLEPLARGSKASGIGLLLESMVGGWDPTCPIRVHFGVDTRKGMKNLLALLGQGTQSRASSPRLIRHQVSLLTLPITGRKWHMVARQLKLWEEPIKPGS